MSLTIVFPLVVVVQSLSCALLFLTRWTAACQAFLSSPISWSLINFLSFESVMLSNYLILCYTLLILSSFFLSIKVFSNESGLGIKWTKYWSFSNSAFNEYSGLIFFRIDWFDIFAVQGTLKNLLQYQFKSINFLVLMVRYHHWHNGHEFEQTPGDSGGQSILACCSPWVAKSQTRLSDWTTQKQIFSHTIYKS